ncbi:glutamate receptor-interacting protein 1-like isoform X2 [Ptychodera flava]|uniref:glutamate receptor-interacting protein 1-like isoform X2 n=1 Tax=Ptychodera flava TaxID=63121 RepID=UPI00396A45A4
MSSCFSSTEAKEPGSSRKKSHHEPDYIVEEPEAAPNRRQSICEERKGKVTVDLIKREGKGLGLIISGGVDKDCKPWVSNLRAGGIAQRSDSLLVGDVISSVNGIRTTNLKHDEIINLLKNAGERVTLELEYELPPTPFENGLTVISKTVELTLAKENNSFGFVVRGGIYSDETKSRPLTVCHIRPGGPSDREGTLKVGDRLLSVDGISLTNASHSEAIAALKQSGHNAVMLIEYDVSIMDAVTNATGPLLIEVAKTPGTNLGVTLSSITNGGRIAIVIDSIKPASIADRCGALHVGDEIRSIDGIDTAQMTVAEASQFLLNSADQIKLEILPISQILPRFRTSPEVTSSMVVASVSPAVKSYPPTVYSTGTLRSTLSRRKLSKSGSGTGTITRSRRQNSNASVTSSVNGLMASGQVCRTETTEVVLESTVRDFGISLQGGVFATEILSSPPIISFLEPGGAAERSGVIQAGDRLITVNNVYTEDCTLDEANQLFRESGPRCTLEIEFDIAESVVPSSGTFHVKLPKTEGGLGITISSPKNRKAGEPLVISQVKKGSVTHRTGTLSPGDRLLAIDGIPLDNCSVEDAAQILHQCDEIVKLRVQKDERFSDDPGSGSVVYSVELVKHGGPLGVTISGTEEPLDPVVISGLTENGVAERTGAIHVGDLILAINGISLRGQPLSEAIRLLQTAGDTVNLKICKQGQQKGQGQGVSRSNTHEAINTAIMSDYENLELDNQSQRAASTARRQHHHSTPMTSADSAVESWDGSGLDAGYHSYPSMIASQGNAGRNQMPARQGNPGMSQRQGRPARPQKSRRNKGQGRKLSHERIGSEDDDEWDLQSNSCHSGRGCGSSDALSSDTEERTANEKLKNDIWSEALRDLEKCGQSDMLKELMEDPQMASNFSGRQYASVGRGGNRPQGAEARSQTLKVNTRGPPADYNTLQEPLQDLYSPTPIELHKVTLFKDHDYDDFGFSVSDGLYERGVYVNSVRSGGPAAVSGNVRAYDRILQVNHTRTRDFDCCMVVPLIAEAEERLELVISRNPLAQVEIQNQQHLRYGWTEDHQTRNPPGTTSSKTV